MAVTLLTADNALFHAIYAPVVQVKQYWSDAWQTWPELELLSAAASTGCHGHDHATFVYRYGFGKQPWDKVTNYYPALGPAPGWWVRLVFYGPGGATFPAWIGQVATFGRLPGGSQSSGACGVEGWTAYGPQHLLRKRHVSQSVWLIDDKPEYLGWVPAMNDRDGQKAMLGSRTSSKYSGVCYLHGGDDLWSNRDYAEYLLACFLDESDTGGPSWKLAGQVDLLEQLSDTLGFSTTQTAADMLRSLIPVAAGLDFVVEPTDSGFAVRIFSLNPTPVRFGGATLPGNPNQVHMDLSIARDVESVRLEQSDTWSYKAVRILGRRLVVVGTLAGSQAKLSGDATYPYAGSLVGHWSDNLESDCKAGTGTEDDPAEEHDLARLDELLRPVYQQFAAAEDWDYNGGTAAPTLNRDGSVSRAPAAHQPKIRRTLEWTPLREGVDYSTDPPQDQNPSGAVAELLPPGAWIWQEDQECYAPVDSLGMALSVPNAHLGISVEASPPHLLAKNHFDDAAPTATKPLYDYETLVATVAWESDQRFGLQWVAPDWSQSGGVFELEVPDAEFWYLAPHTVIGLDSGGQLLTSGETGRVLRNDASRLNFAMAGVMARYFAARSKAVIPIRGLLPWGSLLGSVLACVNDGVGTQAIQSVINGIAWEASGDPTTTVYTGTAQ